MYNSRMQEAAASAAAAAAHEQRRIHLAVRPVDLRRVVRHVIDESKRI